MPDATSRLVLGVFLCDNRPQVSLTRQDENGTADGYRLLGPSFIGTSELLAQAVLSEGDASEVRRMLDAVFPRSLTEDQRAQVDKARAVVANWGLSTAAVTARETVLDNQVRALLAIIDQAFPEVPRG